MRLKQSKVIVMGLILMSLLSCQEKNNANQDLCNKTNSVAVFFNLKAYFCDVISAYESDSILVNKQVRFGNKSEAIENMAINWNVELQTFAAADINRSAWIDKFKVDTITTNNGTTVTYQTTDASIPVKQVAIQFNALDEVNEITILSERKSLLYKSKQKLNFRPDNSYTVVGWQRTMMLSQTDFEVKADILSKN